MANPSSFTFKQHPLSLDRYTNSASTMTQDLPKDIIFDILLRLPVKSLIRFSCVCKSWLALVKNPTFITKHLEKAPTGLLVKRYGPAILDDFISIIPDQERHYYWKFVSSPQSVWLSDWKIVGSCNGLVSLVEIRRGPIFLWNLATRQFRDLPVSNYRSYSMFDEIFGFGYHSGIKDYKLVRIVSEGPEVYSLSTNSWRTLGMLDCRVYETTLCSSLNGHLHWVAHGLCGRGRKFVLSFDMENEVFRNLRIPDGSFARDEMCACLTVFKELLCLISYPKYRLEKSFDVWVMKDYSVEDSWTKLFTVELISTVVKPIGCGRNDAFLFHTLKGDLTVYDSNTQQITYLSFERCSLTLEVFPYVESLVSVGRNEAQHAGG